LFRDVAAAGRTDTLNSIVEHHAANAPNRGEA